MSREVLRDAVIYLPARVIPALVWVVAITVLTRLLSPEQYGQYLLAMTTLMLIASFSFSWLVSVTIRFYIVYGVEPLFRICRPLLIVALFLSLVLWAVGVKLLGGVYSGTFFLSIGIFWLVVYGNFEYFAGWLRARNLAKAYSLALSWRSVAGLFISVALLLFGLQGGEIVILGAACVQHATSIPNFPNDCRVYRRFCDEPLHHQEVHVPSTFPSQGDVPFCIVQSSPTQNDSPGPISSPWHYSSKAPSFNEGVLQWLNSIVCATGLIGVQNG